MGWAAAKRSMPLITSSPGLKLTLKVLPAVLAWYDPKVRAFKRIEVNEKCEISGVTGTITTNAQGKPNVHLHLVLTRQDGSSVSGHLISAVIDPVLEVFVTDLGAGQDVTVP